MSLLSVRDGHCDASIPAVNAAKPRSNSIGPTNRSNTTRCNEPGQPAACHESGAIFQHGEVARGRPMIAGPIPTSFAIVAYVNKP
jgi:hypothetical protein